MKKIIPFLLLLAACRKEPVKQAEPELNVDDFGITNFKEIRNNQESYTPQIPGEEQTIYVRHRTVLLDYNGHTFEGTNWNWDGPVTAMHSGLTTAQKSSINRYVLDAFAPFKVKITTNESTYQETVADERMRVVMTQSWEWYGRAGGVSYTNSFTWGNNTPCFVFTSLLELNAKFIADAVVHEIGHTLGLRHQSSYDADCNKRSDYNYGASGKAPFMGCSYYVAKGSWWVGPNPYGCNNIQVDTLILQKLIPHR